MATCAWCGSKGGFANQLICYSEGLYECAWCSMKLALEMTK